MGRVLMLVGTGVLLLLAAPIVSVTVPLGTVAPAAGALRRARLRRLWPAPGRDARRDRHGLDEVIRQHVNISVTVSDGVYNLMRRPSCTP